MSEMQKALDAATRRYGGLPESERAMLIALDAIYRVLAMPPRESEKQEKEE